MTEPNADTDPAPDHFGQIEPGQPEQDLPPLVRDLLARAALVYHDSGCTCLMCFNHYREHVAEILKGDYL